MENDQAIDRYPRQEHAWGWSERLHLDSRTALFRIHGRKGGASSLHFHRGKLNTFFVSEGALEVATATGGHTIVPPGHSCRIPPWVNHRMIFQEDTIGYEFYEAAEGREIALDDIERVEPGWTPEGMEWKA